MTSEPTAVPGVQKQLTGAPSGPYDCVVRGVDWAVSWATGKALTPTDPMPIRERMGISRPDVGATIDEAKLGFESYQPDALEHGLELGPLNVRDKGANSTTRDANGLVDALFEGHACVSFVWYGKVNSLVPRASGDHSFNGGHQWTLYGVREKPDGSEVDQVRVYDPLHDGAHGRPKGPLWVDLDDVLACLAAFRKGGDPGNDPIGQGKAIYGIAKRAEVQGEPDPAPEEPCEAELERATSALLEVRAWGEQIEYPYLVELADAGLPPVYDTPATMARVQAGARVDD